MDSIKGQCHCGGVEFSFYDQHLSCWSCNCSFCSRIGPIYHRVEPDQFECDLQAESLCEYGSRGFFNHFFCRHCHTLCFSEVSFANEKLYCINLRCCPEVELDRLEIEQFDGAGTY